MKEVITDEAELLNNSSYNFVENRIKNGLTKLPFSPNTKFHVLTFSKAIQSLIFSEKILPLCETLQPVKYVLRPNGVYSRDIICHFMYDPHNTTWDYFVTYSFTSDGTLLFIVEGIQDILNQVVWIQTTSQKYQHLNPYKIAEYNVTIGDFVIGTEYGDFGTSEKPWLHEKTTIMLPIKQEFTMMEEIDHI